MPSQSSVLSWSILLLTLFSSRAVSQCQSYGIDIIIGSTDFIDLNSGAEFSYQGGFLGCVAETCTTALQTPAGTIIDCSSVSTTQTDYESVCPIPHSQMTAGLYQIVLTCPNNGVEFGRAFTVVNTEVTNTVVVTPTVTGTVTPVSTLTSVSTSTEIDTTTLSAQTVTLPNATAGVITIHPVTTTTTTKTILHNAIVATTLSTTSTRTVNARCTSPAARKPDSFSHAAASISSSTSHSSTTKPSSSTSPTASSTLVARRVHPRDLSGGAKLSGRDLVKRVGPDGPLTTTLTISASPVVVLTTVSPASTLTVPSLTVVVSTSTVTPPVQTVFSGTVASTVTAPTTTRTTTVRLQQTSTRTVTRTVRFVVTTTATPSAC